jgi:hypothetical protein
MATTRRQSRKKSPATSSRRRAASPKRRAASPKRRAASPKRRAASPKRRAASPKRRAASPKRSTASPKKRRAPPRKSVKSPGGRVYVKTKSAKRYVTRSGSPTKTIHKAQGYTGATPTRIYSRAARTRRGYIVPEMKRMVDTRDRETGMAKTYKKVRHPDAGKHFEKKVGKKHEVFSGYAYQTEGGVKKSGLTQDARGRIVFKSRQAAGRRAKIHLVTKEGVPIFDARGQMTAAGRAHSEKALAKGQTPKGVPKPAKLKPFTRSGTKKGKPTGVPIRKPKTTSKKDRDVTSGTMYSAKKPRKSARKPRKSARKPRKSARKPRKSARKPRKSAKKPRKSARKPTRKNPSRAAKSKSKYAVV